MPKFESGKVIFLTGRPASGKTAVGLKWVVDYFEMSKRSVQIFSMELMEKELRRMLPENFPVFIEDYGGMDEKFIVDKILERKKTSDVGLVLIDYIQLLKGKINLKDIAKEFNVCVVVLSQLKIGKEESFYLHPDLYDEADKVFRVKHEDDCFNLYDDIDEGRFFEFSESYSERDLCLS